MKFITVSLRQNIFQKLTNTNVKTRLNNGLGCFGKTFVKNVRRLARLMLYSQQRAKNVTTKFSPLLPRRKKPNTARRINATAVGVRHQT
ncbi:MAG: hypothetical protein KF778_12355 [Rhodocyclaceae bacterium]|nr:hypothetical protein [Rhodocyclaceae bacterium]MBX3669191.1 hypothetical protein [Rhodocyclaceae bacterium]